MEIHKIRPYLPSFRPKSVLAELSYVETDVVNNGVFVTFPLSEPKLILQASPADIDPSLIPYEGRRYWHFTETMLVSEFEPPIHIPGFAQNYFEYLWYDTVLSTGAFVSPFPGGIVSSNNLNATLETWLMTVDWDPNTLTWANQPTPAGIMVKNTIEGFGTAFSSSSSGKIVPAVGVTYYGIHWRVTTTSAFGPGNSSDGYTSHSVYTSGGKNIRPLTKIYA